MREKYEYRVIHKAEFEVQTPVSPDDFSSAFPPVTSGTVGGFSPQLLETKLKELGEAGYRLIEVLEPNGDWIIIFSRTHQTSFPRKESAYRRQRK